MAEPGVSERFACRVLGQHRSRAGVAEDEAALTAAIIGLALQSGRPGYRRITAMLRRDGWRVDVKRVERIWRQARRGAGALPGLDPDLPHHVERLWAHRKQLWAVVTRDEKSAVNFTGALGLAAALDWIR